MKKPNIQWEYQVLIPEGKETVGKFLNECGAEGWELAALKEVLGGKMAFFFKRVVVAKKSTKKGK